jgi:hypothetical protein
MMGNLYADWAVLALAAFCLIAFRFTRLIFRIAVLVVAVLLVLRVTWLRLRDQGSRATTSALPAGR